MSSFAVLGKGGTQVTSEVVTDEVDDFSFWIADLETPTLTGPGGEGVEATVLSKCKIARETSRVTDGQFLIEQTTHTYAYEGLPNTRLRPMTMVGAWRVRVRSDQPLTDGIVHVMGEVVIAGQTQYFTAKAQLTSTSRDYPAWEAVAVLSDVYCSYDGTGTVTVDTLSLTFRSGTLQMPVQLQVQN